MITKKNFKEMIQSIGFIRRSNTEIYEKKYDEFDCIIEVDFSGTGSIKYPVDKGLKISKHTTCNFSDNENFVVLECVNRLLEKGYRPEHIELEKQWLLGHEQKGGRADICVFGEDGKTLFIIECKTFGREYDKEVKNTINDGGQIFSYWQQERNCKWLSIYASDFDGKDVIHKTDSIDCSDDDNVSVTAEKDSTILLYKNAHTVEELFNTWTETYDQRFCGDVIFRDDSQAYKIGEKPLRKKDLKDFSDNDKIVNDFEEILRHNNVSDKENAFNRLVALFICKLVDEIQKNDDDEVAFQYKIGSDTYETMQDRLQKLHKEGMERFMKEDILYVSDEYAEKLIVQYTGQKRQALISDLKNTLRILKFYTNNDFAFTDVHNGELFYKNGKILKEVVQLFQYYRIIGSKDIQLLGNLFEQLLNKGFKQNEGQFFTPTPIARFIWDSLPLDMVLVSENGVNYPKIIDYACGAGHFLTEGVSAVNDAANRKMETHDINNSWVEHKLYGIEKDYRLARVSKIALFMHGAGEGNIVYGDGLENYAEKGIKPFSFDILVANPPYSVNSFKPHLILKDNAFRILDVISNNSDVIETLFVERIAQLLKPNGIAAVILPSPLLFKNYASYIMAREELLLNFSIVAIVQLGKNTFFKTGQETSVVFLKKFDESPKRVELINDSIDAIFGSSDLSDWEDNEILHNYLEKILVSEREYLSFILTKSDYKAWKNHTYFGMYFNSFVESQDYKDKVNQKSFLKLEESEQLEILNEIFYKKTISIEKEKIRYFALVYKQNVVVINAPKEKEAEDAFLGYKWNGRKGQEGIDLINEGGDLYDPSDRCSDKVFAGIIRGNYYNKTIYVNELSDKYYYLRLQDMIDFSLVKFTKAIKTAKPRELKNTAGLVNYRLSNKTVFDLNIGDRVVAAELLSNGTIPVYSANVYEEIGKVNKEILTDYKAPSVIWGIDGDWMVNYIEADYAFYPTDHCGYIRIKDKKINPLFFALALQVEGEYERFSRINRASTERISGLVIQIPNKKIQNKIIQMLKKYSVDVRYEKMSVADIDKSSRQLLVDYIGDICASDEIIEKLLRIVR